MATFAELCADVHTITKRPDLVEETKLAVRSATLKAHHSDFFFKDIYETGIIFDNSDYKQQLNVKALVPRYRAWKYFRRYDNSGTGKACEFFDIISVMETQNAYKLDRTGVAYVAGDMLNINSRYAFQYALIGVYLNPDITEANFNSWIAVDHQFAIEFEAARMLFKQIGYDEQETAYARMSAEQFADLKISNISPVGY